MADEEKKGGALAAFMSGGGVPAKKDEVAQALLDSAGQGRSGDGGDVQFLSYSGKMRRYSIGRDKEQPDPDALYVLDPYASVAGWTCWKGGSVAEKHEWSVFDKTQEVPASQLRDHGPYQDDGDGWQFMLGVAMFDVDEPGQMIKFTTTSKSGRNVVADLTAEVAKRIMADEPEVPIIKLADETFTAQGKTNGKPKFEVEGWTTRQEVETFINLGDDGDVEDLLSGTYAGGAGEAEAESGPDPEPEEKPAKGRRRARRTAA